ENLGTSDSPFATLTHAVSVAEAGDTVKLAEGTYGVGETWPVTLAGVSLVGVNPMATGLEGPGADSEVTALVLEGPVEVSDLSVVDFEIGLAAQSGDITLNRVASQHNRLGLRGLTDHEV